MRKIFLSFLQVLILILIGTFFIHNFAFADEASCSISPKTVDDHQAKPSFKITAPKDSLGAGHLWRIVVGANSANSIGPLPIGGGQGTNACHDYLNNTTGFWGNPIETSSQCYFYTGTDAANPDIPLVTAADGTQTLDFTVNQWRNPIQSGWDLWVDVYSDIKNANPDCIRNDSMKIHVNASTNFGDCNIKFIPPPPPDGQWTPSTDMKFYVIPPGDPSIGGWGSQDSHHIWWKTVSGATLKEAKKWTSQIEDQANPYDLGTQNAGQYQLQVTNLVDILGASETMQCQATISIDDNGGGYVNSIGGTPCRLCDSNSTWRPKSTCTDDPSTINDCCQDIKDSSKYDPAIRDACPAGTVCDGAHRSRDQSTTGTPTGCLPLTSNSDVTGISAPPPVCSTYDTGRGDAAAAKATKCVSIDTDLGISLPTEPGPLINALVGIVLSAAGGIAIVLIMISGYKMMISQGNPEQIKDAREQLTAAIIGLLFVIFSLVILQFIGINVLNLPGFK